MRIKQGMTRQLFGYIIFDLDKQYWRAVFDEQHATFVVGQAGWVDVQPQIEYRPTYFSADEVPEIAYLGGIDKWRQNEDGLAEGKFFAFGTYPDQAAVEAELDDASLFDFEGLFELGSEDAYSQRS